MRLLILASLFLCQLAMGGNIAEYTGNMKQVNGFLMLYVDEMENRVYLELSDETPAMIYQTTLATGAGNGVIPGALDLGLDRGRLMKSRLVHFRRYGKEFVLQQENMDFRASTENQAEQKTVRDAFAFSILARLPIVAEDENRYLVDINGLLLSDVAGIEQNLKDLQQGKYKLDSKLSLVDATFSRSFPRNTEMEAIQTFSSDNPGSAMSTVTPTPGHLSLRVRHSFVQLPDDNYQPRTHHPATGFFAQTWQDYASDIEDDLVKRVIWRHRLEKVYPERDSSPVKKPIIYYVEAGTPEPVRSALVEGASWWAEAFQSAGFEDAFRVEILPEDADPLDIRYNVIQWVHRISRGWSYGFSVRDPRTGEILKGHVTLGSLRVRQDIKILQSLLAPGNDSEKRSEIRKTALARIRQLSAHEVGHTLGLLHNFAASMNDRASVMDYPHPLLTLNNGKLDLSGAYDSGIGEWDKLAVQWGYGQFSRNEQAELDKIYRKMLEAGQDFISDSDARRKGSAHPKASLWDNSDDPVAELQKLMKIRALALDGFDNNVLTSDEPAFILEDHLPPLYLLHRYQLEAVGKLLAGANYRYSMAGESGSVEYLDANAQIRALNGLLYALQAENLVLPQQLIRQLLPAPPGYARNQEFFKSKAGRLFDPYSAIDALADHVLGLILEPSRVHRLQLQHHYQDKLPGLLFVMKTLEKQLFAGNESGLLAHATHRVQSRYVEALIRLHSNKNTDESAKGIVRWHLEKLAGQKPARHATETAIHRHQLANRIRDYLREPEKYPADKADIPPGSPIGQEAAIW